MRLPSRTIGESENRERRDEESRGFGYSLPEVPVTISSLV